MVQGDLSGELCAGLSPRAVQPRGLYQYSRAKDQSTLRIRSRDLAYA